MIGNRNRLHQGRFLVAYVCSAQAPDDFVIKADLDRLIADLGNHPGRKLRPGANADVNDVAAHASSLRATQRSSSRATY
jgi:hypothetical protein